MCRVFRAAKEEDFEAVFSLIEKRVRWMDEVGIRQWNVTDYLTVYPREYYRECQKREELFVCEEAKKILGVFVLFDRDERWQDDEQVTDACYLHNLATDPRCPGLGRALVSYAERLTFEKGNRRLRLDCAVDNPYLNTYYEEMGYERRGECVDGLYIGVLRERWL